jgi:hypothetical protein
MMWRAWYLRNDAVHVKGEGTIAGSAVFLASYALALHIVNDDPGSAEDNRGKAKVHEGTWPKKKSPIERQERKKDQATWKAPRFPQGGLRLIPMLLIVQGKARRVWG